MSAALGMGMNGADATLAILATVGTIGAIDVLYFHLYRFRLFAAPASVAEEVTHLVRHVVFLAILAVATQAPTGGWVLAAFALFAIDLVNAAVDVLLERSSREPLGGLPSAEYLIHVVSTFGTGAAAASYAWSVGSPAPDLGGLVGLQVRGMFAAGLLLFVVEAALFARALSARRGGGELAAAA